MQKHLKTIGAALAVLVILFTVVKTFVLDSYRLDIVEASNITLGEKLDEQVSKIQTSMSVQEERLDAIDVKQARFEEKQTAQTSLIQQVLNEVLKP